MGLFGLGKTREQNFWIWFQKNETRLFEFEKDKERNFESLSKALAEVSPKLAFALGPVKDGRREFIVSASGDKQEFPSVIALVDAAPELSRWTVMKFRPRVWPIGTIRFGGVEILSTDVEFNMLGNGREIGLYMYIPGYVANKIYQQIGFLILDHTLGEYDAVTKLSMIKFFPKESAVIAPRSPLAQLPSALDVIWARIHPEQGS